MSATDCLKQINSSPSDKLPPIQDLKLVLNWLLKQIETSAIPPTLITSIHRQT